MVQNRDQTFGQSIGGAPECRGKKFAVLSSEKVAGIRESAEASGMSSKHICISISIDEEMQPCS